MTTITKIMVTPITARTKKPVIHTNTRTTIVHPNSNNSFSKNDITNVLLPECQKDYLIQPKYHKCVVGIEKIWVHRKYRRCGIATRLLDTVRTTFTYGYIIPKSQ